ncbi:ParB/RepB/Spo0J family partition protein [Nonomuraea lactucae]|uniref:ParB/RepB/Spo0J family partition protein n=1 Tax=Nonomuraea lactucae TaxID=2249762 RepID=UPI000DE4F38B|nr:ParB/RepB/Spo0J family partition protein [Nonomuraea lactucae]
MAEIATQEYRMVRVDELEPHPDNPHRGDIDLIAGSIKRFGFYGSVVVQSSRMRIIAGEHRWRGATKAGLKKIPAVVLDVDDDTALRILLADNRLGEFGGYDDTKLVELLQGLPDLDGTGWRDEDLADLLDDLAGEIDVIADEAATPQPPARSAPATAAEDEGEGGDGDLEDEESDEDDVEEAAPSAPRPKTGITVELIVTLTAAQHAEVTELLDRIRARDGEAPLPEIVLAALRIHADR